MRESYDLGEYVLNQIRRNFLQKSADVMNKPEILNYQRQYFNRGITRRDYDRLKLSADIQTSGLDGIEIKTGSGEEIFSYYRTAQSAIQGLIRDSLNSMPYNALVMGRYFEQHHILIARRTITFSDQRPGTLLTAMIVPPSIAEPYLRIKNAYLFLSNAEEKDIKAIARRTDNYFLTFGIFFLVQVVIIALFTWLYNRPLRMLARETGMIAGQREDFHLSAVSRNDEIGMIARSIQSIISNAERQQQRMLDLEKSALWREIAQRLAHEIKNPLTPIQLTLQRICDAFNANHPRYPEILKECSAIIQEELNRLRVLTKEFSDFAKLPDFHFNKAALNTIIKDVVMLYGHKRINLRLDNTIPDLFLDTDAIKRVLINLIDNAIAAEDPERLNQIDIITRDNDETVVLQISDRGKGIPKENLQKIFEPHFSTKSASMGLGLAIVKTILDRHNALIDVESIERSGTIFTIKLIKSNPLFSSDRNIQ